MAVGLFFVYIELIMSRLPNSPIAIGELAIGSRTQNMTAFDPNDTYVIGLAERQMKANSDLRQMLFDCDKKGEWSGWKVKIDYEVHNGHEQNYRAERWFFLDKEGSMIFKTMEFPLP